MKEQKQQEYELTKFVCDSAHFSFEEIDGYQRKYNAVISPREAGKSTALWRKIYNNFKKKGHPSIILRRMIVDITETYLGDIETLLNKFLESPIHLVFKRGDIKSGIVDIMLNGKVFVRCMGLSAPMSRLKSMVLRDVDYMVFDEFICNMRVGEKYLKDETMRFKEIYTTYNRESEKGITCYFMGNPYSLFNPYFSWWGVNSKELKPGALLTGKTWAIQVYQISETLKRLILDKNPLYQFDDSYRRYGFDGEAINDKNIRIIDKAPEGFTLRFVFGLNSRYLGVFRGYDNGVLFWCRLMDLKEISARRDIITFDFSDLAEHCVLFRPEDKGDVYFFRSAIEFRQVGYKSVEENYMAEEIYSNL